VKGTRNCARDQHSDARDAHNYTVGVRDVFETSDTKSLHNRILTSDGSWDSSVFENIFWLILRVGVYAVNSLTADCHG
jgi:hypothetical protein